MFCSTKNHRKVVHQPQSCPLIENVVWASVEISLLFLKEESYDIRSSIDET